MFSDVQLVDIDPLVRATGDLIRQLKQKERAIMFILYSPLIYFRLKANYFTAHRLILECKLC